MPVLPRSLVSLVTSRSHSRFPARQGVEAFSRCEGVGLDDFDRFVALVDIGALRSRMLQ